MKTSLTVQIIKLHNQCTKAVVCKPTSTSAKINYNLDTLIFKNSAHKHNSEGKLDSFTNNPLKARILRPTTLKLRGTAIFSLEIWKGNAIHPLHSKAHLEFWLLDYFQIFLFSLK